MIGWKRGCIGLAVVIGIGGGCASRLPGPVEIPADPGATFAAHEVSGGLMIDKMEGGQTGVLQPSTTSGPQFVLYSASIPAAAFWVTGPKTVVRSAPDPSAPLIGEVDATWDKRAIRLTLKPEGRPTYSTSVFKRVSGEGGPDALGQPVDSTLTLRGVYRADIVDSNGAPAGWLQVRFGHAGSSHRVYDGVLPATLNGPIAVAAAARLDAEVSSVLKGATNPYVGS